MLHRCHKIAFACATTLLGCAVVAAGLLFQGLYFSPVFTPVTAKPASANTYRGVNLGGWLVLEPWTTPSLFYPFLCVGGTCPPDSPPVVDESSFCARLGESLSRRVLADFRDRWVTEDTFHLLAASGINTVRVPFGWWLFGDQPDGPCYGVPSVQYLDKAVEWATTHRLQLILDLHGVKPTQNGMDHSGRSSHPPYAHAQPAYGRPPLDGSEWLQPANVAVTRSVLRAVAARYANRTAVVRIGMVNEPMMMDRPWCDSGCPMDVHELVNYYNETWREVAQIVPPSQQPVLDAGLGGNLDQWRLAIPLPRLLQAAGAVLDMHFYQAWTWHGISAFPQAWHLRIAGCDAAAGVKQMAAQVAPVMVGEWSTALTDCATWLNGLGLPSGAMGTGAPGDCSRVPCPTTFNNLTEGATLAGGPDAEGTCPTGRLPSEGGPLGPLPPEEFYALLTEYMVAAYEGSAGWTFWNFANEMKDPRWSFLDARRRGWFPRNLSAAAYAPRLPDCSQDDVPLFGSLYRALSVAVGAAVAAVTVAVGGVGCVCVARCSQKS